MQNMFIELFDQTRLMTFFFVVIRTGGLLFTVPVFSSTMVRPQVRMFIALMLGVLLYRIVPPVPFDGGVATLYLAIQIIKELLIGVAIGTLTSTLFTGAQIGGYFVDFQMGFTMVNVMDPSTGGSFSFLSEVINITITLIFIAVGGVRLIIQSIVFSYTLLPTGNFEFHSGAIMFAVETFAKVFMVAITIVSPPIIALMALNVLLGVLARVIPQINLMVVGFPVKIAVGMGMFIVGLHFFYVAFEKLMYLYFKYVQELMRLAAG